MLIWQKQWQNLLHAFPKSITIYMWLIYPISLFFTVSSSALQIIMTTLAFGCIVHGFDYSGILRHQGLKILGDISYSIYLLHGIVLYFLFKIFAIYNFQEGNIYHFIAYQPLVAFLTICLSLLTYHYIERPFIKKKPTKP